MPGNFRCCGPQRPQPRPRRQAARRGAAATQQTAGKRKAATSAASAAAQRACSVAAFWIRVARYLACEREPTRDLPMTNIEETPRKLTLKAGSTTLTLDKEFGKATLQQKMLLWNKKPVEFALADIDDIAVKSDVDGLVRRINPSQRVAPAYWRDHCSHNRGSQGRRRNGQEATWICRTVGFGRKRLLLGFRACAERHGCETSARRRSCQSPCARRASRTGAFSLAKSGIG